ncbi:MAG: 50S ribosomal protein L24 [Thermoplasmatota archaeon]
MVTIQPRKARKQLANLPTHLARRQVSSHLSDDLIKKYDRRTIVLRKGDTVRVIRGDFRGTTGKVLEVDPKARRVQVEGVTVTKADKTQRPRPISPSNLIITKLDLSDKLRRNAIGEKEAPAEPKPKRASRVKAEASEESASESPKPAATPASKEGADDQEEAGDEEESETSAEENQEESA